VSAHALAQAPPARRRLHAGLPRARQCGAPAAHRDHPRRGGILVEPHGDVAGRGPPAREPGACRRACARLSFVAALRWSKDVIIVTRLRAATSPLYRPDLLVLDELGYLPCDSRAADLLYNIISHRHEQRSTIICKRCVDTTWKAAAIGRTMPTCRSLSDRATSPSPVATEAATRIPVPSPIRVERWLDELAAQPVGPLSRRHGAAYFRAA
jgi:IstB-like ATP binding protein